MKHYLTVKQIKEMYGLSEGKVRQIIAGIPHENGKKWYIEQSEFERRMR